MKLEARRRNPAAVQQALSDFRDLDHVTTLVGATVGADPMGQFVLVAVGAFREGRPYQGIVGPTAVPPGPGVSSLWIGHFIRPDDFRLEREL